MAAPFRPCDHCPKPAVVHNTVIVDGQMTEVHLCEDHAQAAGIQMPGQAPIHQLLGQLAQVGAARPRGPSCPECGHSFHDFKTSGLLGCAAAQHRLDLHRALAVHGAQAQVLGQVARFGVDAQALGLLMDLGDNDLLDLHLGRKTLAQVDGALVREDVRRVLDMLRKPIER